jgi:hypothetical protein
MNKIEQSLFLPPEIVASLDKYYLRQWSGSYLVSKILQATPPNAFDDYITNQDVTYKVQWYNTSPSYLLAHREDQFRVSFRRLSGTSQGIVLIARTSLTRLEQPCVTLKQLKESGAYYGNNV